MAEARDIESTEMKIHDLVDESDEDPGNDVTSLVKLDTSIIALSLSVTKKTSDILTPSLDCVDGAKPLELISSADSPTVSKRLKSAWANNPSVSGNHEQKVAVNNNCGKLDSLCEIDIPNSHADSLTVKSSTSQLKSKYRHFSSGVRSSEQTNQNTVDSNTIPKKIPALLDLHPRPHPDFIKLNASFLRQFEPKRGNCPTASSKTKQGDKKIAVHKSNLRKKTLSYYPNKPHGRANTFQLNPQAKESKSIQVNRLTVSSKSERGNNKQQTCANVKVIDSTINIGKPFSYADVVKGNNKMQVLQSKYENIPASSLQQSKTPQEQEPRLNRLARFLTLSIKPWFMIYDNVNNDSNHGKHIPQKANECRLTVVPDLYKSLWVLSVRRVAYPLPQLEMSLTEFVQMVGETFQEPEFEKATVKYEFPQTTEGCL